MHTPLRILIVLVVLVFSPHEKVSRKNAALLFEPRHAPRPLYSSTVLVLLYTRSWELALGSTFVLSEYDGEDPGYMHVFFFTPGRRWVEKPLGICMYANNMHLGIYEYEYVICV